MSQSKLQINLREGRVEVEGDTAFVTQVYNDFKDILLRQAEEPADDEPPADTNRGNGGEQKARPARKAKRPTPTKKSSGDEGEVPALRSYKPRVDGSLDLVKLKAFMAEYEPKNNVEKMLLYIKFLNDELKVEPVHIDHLFTCFHSMRDQIPTAFGQMLISARGKHGVVSFSTVADIAITTRGLNAVNHDIAKKKADAA